MSESVCVKGGLRVSRLPRRALPLALLAILAVPAFACEPIPVLLYIVGAPAMFAIGTLGGVVLIKCGIYTWFERQLPRRAAFGYLFLGNLCNSILGLFMAAALSTWLFVLWALPLLALTLYVPARLCLHGRKGGLGKLSAGFSAVLVALLLVVSTALWMVSQTMIASEESAPGSTVYWPVKIGSCILAVAASLTMTTLWEGWVVTRLARARKREGDFFPAVAKANLVVFFVIALAAAAWTLPERWGQPSYLIQAYHLVKSAFV